MYKAINAKIEKKEPVNREDALWLLNEGELLQAGRLADNICRQRHRDGRVTFVVDRNVNYTNICESQCRFCAFYRDKTASEPPPVLDEETIFSKIAELVAQGGTQLLIRGGFIRNWELDFFERLFAGIKSRFPLVQNHSLSPAEITHIASLSKLSVPKRVRPFAPPALTRYPAVV